MVSGLVSDTAPRANIPSLRYIISIHRQCDHVSRASLFASLMAITDSGDSEKMKVNFVLHHFGIPRVRSSINIRRREWKQLFVCFRGARRREKKVFCLLFPASSIGQISFALISILFRLRRRHNQSSRFFATSQLALARDTQSHHDSTPIRLSVDWLRR